MEPQHRKKFFRVLMYLALILLLIKVLIEDKNKVKYYQIDGVAFGVIPYVIKAKYKEGGLVKVEIDSIISSINQAISTYKNDSEISRFNRSDTLVFESSIFYPFLELSAKIHEKTAGAFDPTVGPLINAWGFGPKRHENIPSKTEIDSLLAYVGFKKLTYTKDYVIKPKGMYLDFTAMAEGYTIDAIALYMEQKGIENYLIELGGEMRAKGKNEKNKTWTIGINDPTAGKDNQALYASLILDGKSISTSGNYRNYREVNGQLYAHIIDPRTGYTEPHTLLSASIVANTALVSDALATACMVLGPTAAFELIEKETDIEGIFILQSTSGLQLKCTSGLVDKVKRIEKDK